VLSSFCHLAKLTNKAVFNNVKRCSIRGTERLDKKIGHIEEREILTFDNLGELIVEKKNAVNESV